MRIATALVLIVVALIGAYIGLGYVGKTAVREDEAPAVVKQALKELQVTELRGAPGETGKPGLACWDTDGDGEKDDLEDVNNDGLWDALDCRGDKGEPGTPGEKGKDGVCSTECCKPTCPAPVVTPDPVPARPYVIVNREVNVDVHGGAKVEVTAPVTVSVTK